MPNHCLQVLVRFDRILFLKKYLRKKDKIQKKWKEKEKKSFEERSLGLLQIQLGIPKITSNYQNIEDGVGACHGQFGGVVQ